MFAEGAVRSNPGISQLRWTLQGNIDAVDVILLVHGQGGDAAGWSPLLPELCEEGRWRCLCLDTGDQLADAVDAAAVAGLLDTLGAGSRAIVSTTSGCVLAARLAESAQGFAATCLVEDAAGLPVTPPPGNPGAIVCSTDFAVQHGLDGSAVHSVHTAPGTAGVMATRGAAEAILAALAAQLPPGDTVPHVPQPEPRVVFTRVERFSLQLTQPLQLSAGTAISERQGALLFVTTSTGHVGAGECTPLPAFHAESAEEATAQLERAARALHGRTLPAALAALDGCFAAWLHPAACGDAPAAVIPGPAEPAGLDVSLAPHFDLEHFWAYLRASTARRGAAGAAQLLTGCEACPQGVGESARLCAPRGRLGQRTGGARCARTGVRAQGRGLAGAHV